MVCKVGDSYLVYLCLSVALVRMQIPGPRLVDMMILWVHRGAWESVFIQQPRCF